MTDTYIWQHPPDDEPRYFVAEGHDITPEKMITDAFTFLAEKVNYREARGIFHHYHLWEGPVERTHFQMEGDDVEKITVLNVKREPHPMTDKEYPDNAEEIRRRLEI